MSENLLYGKYKEIGCIDNEKGWKLIKNYKTDVLYILKRLQRYDAMLFTSLKSNPHPNIAKIEESSIENNELIVIEEYIQGRNLVSLLKEKHKLDPQEVTSITINVCKALMHLHSLPIPIIHRDIKLANIMIDNHSHVILVDFDVSRFYKTEMNMDTTILGTEGYAAPEQFGFKQTDARSDIYALGIVMNFLLTGMHPKEFLCQGELTRIIQKCICFDPEDRYESALDLYKDLTETRFVETRKTPFWVIPGFRTKTIWKMIVALFGYAVMFNMIFTHESKYTNEIMVILDNTFLGVAYIAIFLLYTNYMNVCNKLEFFNSNKLSVRLWGYGIYSFIILLIYAVCIMILSTIFK